MKDIFKALGIAIGVIVVIIIVVSGMVFGLEWIKSIFNLSNMNMIYGLLTFLVIFIFSITYHALSEMSKKNKK